MDMARRVEPEWLDHLPAADPRALRSRRDLRRVNAMMANARIVRGELARTLRQGIGRMAEIGAGDGAFALAFARGVHAGPPAELVLVDRQPLVTPALVAQFAREGWNAQAVAADVFEWLGADTPPFDAIVANLFLHHFEHRELATMLALVAARTRVFVACEPRRSPLALAGSHLLGLVGCNDVTRHDAVVSVRAGFRGRELASLWPQGSEWAVEEGARGLFSHCFMARRV